MSTVLYLAKGEDMRVHIHTTEGEVIRDISFTGLLKQWLYPQLTTLEGRIEATKRVFHFKAKVPIWIDGAHLLIPMVGIRSELSLCVNYHAIARIELIEDQKAQITLINHQRLILRQYPAVQRAYARAKVILDHLDSAHGCVGETRTDL